MDKPKQSVNPAASKLVEPEAAGPLGAETPEIVAKGTTVGTARLSRPFLPEALAASVGALAFPMGFVILLIGKSELFTENFLLPVLGVLQRRAPLRSLFRLWTVSLTFNLLGAAVFALLIGLPGVLEPAAAADIIAVAEHKLSMGWGEAFVRAIFAGWLMTILTWLLLACNTVGERLAIIWTIASLIVLGRFNHAVISSWGAGDGLRQAAAPAAQGGGGAPRHQGAARLIARGPAPGQGRAQLPYCRAAASIT